MSATLPLPFQRGFALVVSLALVLGALVPLAAVPPIRAQSTTLVVSQVYGGGGNSGAPYTHDFVELFNLSDETVSLDGLSLQYASATGTGNFGATTGQLTELSGSIPAGGYFLVQQAGGTTGAPLPTPDLVDESPINMAAGAGKVALVDGTTSLGCNGGSTPCNPDQLARIIDLIGYGNANFFEGSAAAPELSNTTSAHRADGGCTDTDDNAADFTAAGPAPRNSASPLNPCDGSEPEPTDPTGAGSAIPAAVEPGGTTTLSVTVTPGANPTSTGIAVSADLTPIGGTDDQALTDAGEGTFTHEATVDAGVTTGEKTITAVITDEQERTGNATITLTVVEQGGDVGGVVISQFRVRGPNGAADEFVEIHNPTHAPIDVGGWLIRGSNASGTTSTRATIPAGTVIAPGCFYLFTNSSTSGGPYSGLVAGDQAFTVGITDDGGIGITLPDLTVVDAAGMSTGSAYVEGSPLAPLSGTGNNVDQAYERKPGGDAGHGTDTGDNASDFALIAPSDPSNSASPCVGDAPADEAPEVVSTTPADRTVDVATNVVISITFSEPVDVADGWYEIECTISGSVAATVSGGPETFDLTPDESLSDGDACTVTIVAVLVTDQDADDPPDAMAEDHLFTFLVGSACDHPTHAIHEIQGDGAATPIPGRLVFVRGVVTADFTSGGASGIPANQGLRGFFMEAIVDDRDEDPMTSEGIFVFDGAGTFAGDVGGSVFVVGTAGEFSEVTQITASEIGDCDGFEWELPAPAELPLPVAPDDRGTVLEPLESMRVVHEELTVVEFFQLERFGEIRLSASGVLQTPTNVHLPASPEAVELAAHNAAATIILDDGRTGQNLNRLDSEDLLPYLAVGETLRIGDQLSDHAAVLHFGFNAWRLQPIDIDAITAELASNRTRPRPETPPDVGGNLKVASFNVLNYFDGDGQGEGFPTARGATTPSELARQTEKLVDAITRLDADVYGLIEMENDGGEFQATRTLVDALNAELGAEVYRFVDTGVIGTDAIKQAFIYKRATVTPVGDFAILDSSVDPRYDSSRSRPALAQTFTLLGTGERVTVVVNHFKSKGQSGLTDRNDPDFDQGDGQGFWNHTRTQSALALADWLATNPTGVQSLGALIIGDLNAYGREDPIRALEDAGYVDQLILHSDGPPYSFTFDGMQGTLDTALALPSLAARVTGAAEWHINADEVPAIDYQESDGVPFNQRFRTPEIAEAYYDPSAFRSSDHDPVVIGLDLGRSRHPGPPAR